MEVLEYDTCGRMKYHPEYHENNRKQWKTEDLEYMCKYVEIDGNKTISLALGRTEMTVASKLTELKKNGLYEYYKNRNEFW